MSALLRAVATLNSRYPARRILITGATSGSGEALALLFGRYGWRVAVTGRNREKVALSAKKVRAAGGQALEIDLEVTRYEDFEGAARQVAEAWGGLDISSTTRVLPVASRSKTGLSTPGIASSRSTRSEWCTAVRLSCQCYESPAAAT